MMVGEAAVYERPKPVVASQYAGDHATIGSTLEYRNVNDNPFAADDQFGKATQRGGVRCDCLIDRDATLGVGVDVEADDVAWRRDPLNDVIRSGPCQRTIFADIAKYRCALLLPDIGVERVKRHTLREPLENVDPRA